MWKLIYGIAVGTSAISLALIFPTLSHAQIDFQVINSPVDKMDAGAAASELDALLEYVTHYPSMAESEKKAWETKVRSPYPDARAPVESSTVDGLYVALSSESLQKQDDYWPFAYKAVRALHALVSPNDERLVASARTLLKRNLPETVDYIPHEGLIEVCLEVLVTSDDPKCLTLLRSAETTEFWAGRTEHAHLSDPSPYLDGEADALLSTLRSKAPAALLKLRHDDGAAWAEEILARTNEGAGYRRLIEGVIEYYSPASLEQRNLNRAIP